VRPHLNKQAGDVRPVIQAMGEIYVSIYLSIIYHYLSIYLGGFQPEAGLSKKQGAQSEKGLVVL
jgi:hypothetical protein